MENELSLVEKYIGYTFTDTRYNDSTIVREQKGKVIRIFGEKLKGDALIDAYCRAGL